jgi:hypothetical protein
VRARPAEYLDLLRTYSSTLGMRPADAAGPLACSGRRIDGRYGRRTAKRSGLVEHAEDEAA